MRGRQLYQKQDENGIATGHYIQFIQLDSKTILNQGMFGFLNFDHLLSYHLL